MEIFRTVVHVQNKSLIVVWYKVSSEFINESSSKQIMSDGREGCAKLQVFKLSFHFLSFYIFFDVFDSLNQDPLNFD